MGGAPKVKYELWGQKKIGKGPRKRLRFNLPSEAEARRVRKELIAVGFADVVIGQRAPSYGRINGIQKWGTID